MKVKRSISKRKTTVGIEFSKTGMRAVAVTTGRAVPEIVASTSVVVEREDWWESPDDVVQMKQSLLTFVMRNKLKKGAAVLSIPNERAILRYLQLPPIPEKAVKNAVQLELGVSIHLPFEDPVFDVVRVPSLNPEANAEHEAFHCLVAAPRALVEQMAGVVSSTGLRPIAVDISPLSLWRLSGTTPDNTGSFDIFVQADARELSVSVFIDEFLYFIRSVPYALPEFRPDESSSRYAADIAYEIERVVNFFNFNLSPVERSVRCVYVQTSLSSAECLVEHLSQRLSCFVTLIEPHLQWGQDARPDSALYPAIGLALKEVATA